MPDINERNLNDMINFISTKTGVEDATLKNAVKSKSAQDLLGALNPSQAQKLQKILSDKSSMEKLLKTEQAQKLLKNLIEGK